MKILKHGKFKRQYFICPRCGCEFLPDFKEYMAHFSQNGKLEWFSSICPECGCETESSKEYGENEVLEV